MPVHGDNGVDNGEETCKTATYNNKLGDHSSNQAGKVFQMKNGGTSSSEVRRPVGICMNVMSTVFCRKVFALNFFFPFPCGLVSRSIPVVG